MKTRILMSGLLLMGCLAGNAQKFLWSNSFGVADVETRTKGMSIDANDNVYVTGNFQVPELTIGGISITGASSSMDAFIAKFTKDNECPFAASIRSAAGFVSVQDIAVDSRGNVYVVGNFDTEAVITDEIKLTSDYQDIFIAKFDAEGNPVWIKGIVSGMAPIAKSIAVDAADNFVVSGTFAGTLNVNINGGTDEISSGSSQSALFVVKYGSDGELIWSKVSEGSGTGVGNRIAADGEGNIYVAGEFSGDIAFGAGCSMSAVTTENTDNFILKYNAAGDLVWGRSLKGTKLDNIADMDVRGGKLVITGVVRSQDLVIDNEDGLVIKCNDTTEEGTNYNILVVMFNTEGEYEWNYVGGGLLSPSEAYAVKLDQDGSVWNSGVASGTFYFNPTAEDESKMFSSKSRGGRDMYLLKLSSQGQVLIGYRVGDNTSEEVSHIVLGNEGLMFASDLVALRKSGDATQSPVGLYGDPVAAVTPMGYKLNVAILCYRQIYAAPVALESAKLNETYHQVIVAENANGEVDYSLYYGTLPEGIILDGTSGILSGTPSRKGIYDFVICMKDAEGNTGFADYRLNVSEESGIGNAFRHDVIVRGGNGRVRITAGTAGNRMTVYDLSGRICLEKDFDHAADYALSEGMYIVVVTSGAGDRIICKVTL